VDTKYIFEVIKYQVDQHHSEQQQQQQQKQQQDIVMILSMKKHSEIFFLSFFHTLLRLTYFLNPLCSHVQPD
jgi:hypothetical protein